MTGGQVPGEPGGEGCDNRGYDSENDSAAVEFTLRPDADLIEQIVDHVVVLAYEAQTMFAQRFLDCAWWVDLEDPAVFWFGTEPPAAFVPHFIGSSSTVSNTWLWGWENINGFPDRVVELAASVYQAGVDLGIADLTTPQQSLDPAERVGQGILARDTPEHVFVLCALAVSGLSSPVYYRGPTDGGYAWFVLDNEAEFRLDTPTPTAAAMALTGALSSGYVTDHRLAVTAYAQRRAGVSLGAVGDAGTDITLGFPDGTLRIDFDDHQRIVGVTTSDR